MHSMICFEPLPRKEAEFRNDVLQVAKRSRTEPGCLRLDVFESLRELFIFAIHSECVDEASFELHATLPHTVRFLEAAAKLQAHPIQAVRLRQIGSGAKSVET